MHRRFVLSVLVAALTFAAIKAQPANKKVLYLTYSAGFRHDVIPLSMELLPQIGKKNGFDVVATKDLAFLSAVSLPAYDAVVFYTTIDMPDLTESVR